MYCSSLQQLQPHGCSDFWRKQLQKKSQSINPQADKLKWTPVFLVKVSPLIAFMRHVFLAFWDAYFQELCNEGRVHMLKLWIKNCLAELTLPLSQCHFVPSVCDAALTEHHLVLLSCKFHLVTWKLESRRANLPMNHLTVYILICSTFLCASAFYLRAWIYVNLMVISDVQNRLDTAQVRKRRRATSPLGEESERPHRIKSGQIQWNLKELVLSRSGQLSHLTLR